MRYVPGGAEIRVGATTFAGRSHTEIVRLIAFDHGWKLHGDEIIDQSEVIVTDTLEELARRALSLAGSTPRERGSTGITLEARRHPTLTRSAKPAPRTPTRNPARRVDRAEWMRFSLDPIELTVQAVVTKDVNGEIGWKIVEFGAKYDSQTTQSITLKLTPQWQQADGTLTINFTVASDTAARAHFGAED